MGWDGDDRRRYSPDIPWAQKKEELSDLMNDSIERHLLSDQHLFLQVWMAKEKRKQELWEKIKAQVIGWGCIAAITFFLSSFWHEIMTLLHLKGR